MLCRLNAPLVVLAYSDNHNAAVTIPAGEIIEVVGLVENDDRFAVVQFAGEQFGYPAQVRGRRRRSPRQRCVS